MKTAQKNTRVWNTKLGLAVLVVVFMAVLAGVLLKSWGDFIKPLTSINSKRFLWDGSSNINILVLNKTVGILSYNPFDAKITTLEIPGQTYLNVEGSGDWKISSIYDLGQLSDPPQGSKLLTSSVSEFLGVPIDGFIQTTQLVGQGGANGVMEQIRRAPLDLTFIIRQFRTDLSFMEIARLLWKLPQVRFDKVQKLSLNDLGLLEKKKLADGSEIYTADQIRLNSLKYFIESKISQEGLSIAVFNATKQPGLGGKAARVITNIGGNVIIISNSEVLRKRSVVLINSGLEGSSEARSSLTFKKLKTLFVYNSGDENDLNDPQLKLSRASINVVLGDDFYHEP